ERPPHPWIEETEERDDDEEDDDRSDAGEEMMKRRRGIVLRREVRIVEVEQDLTGPPADLFPGEEHIRQSVHDEPTIPAAVGSRFVGRQEEHHRPQQKVQRSEPLDHATLPHDVLPGAPERFTVTVPEDDL